MFCLLCCNPNPHCFTQVWINLNTPQTLNSTSYRPHPALLFILPTMSLILCCTSFVLIPSAVCWSPSPLSCLKPSVRSMCYISSPIHIFSDSLRIRRASLQSQGHFFNLMSNRRPCYAPVWQQSAFLCCEAGGVLVLPHFY